MKVLFWLGPAGVLSILLALTALILHARSWAEDRGARTRVRSLAAALLALFAAGLASARISEFEVDRSTELREAIARSRTAAPGGSDAPAPRYAETTDADSLPDGERDTYLPSDEEPAWKRHGKQQRTVAGADSDAPGQPGDPTSGEADPSARTPTPGAIVLPEAEVNRANRLDRFNLFFARMTALLVAGGTLIGYLRSFNRIPSESPPLPVASGWIDSISPKDHHLYLPDIAPPDLNDLLKTLALRNETLLILGENPLPPALPRWIRPLSKPILTPSPNLPTPDDLLETLWFGRAHVTVGDPESAGAILTRLDPFLSARARTRARAAATVNVVIPPELLPATLDAHRLADLATTTNHRLIWLRARPEKPGRSLREISSNEFALARIPAPETALMRRLLTPILARLPFRTP